jgi:autotransporter-associated beta strand protein
MSIKPVQTMCFDLLTRMNTNIPAYSKTRRLAILLIAIAAACAIATRRAAADTTWISTSDRTFSTAANWNNGLPSTGPQLAIFADSGAIQHSLDLSTTARNALGIQFNAFSGTGSSGFTFMSTSATPGGFQNRATGVGGSTSIVNNNANVQTFNVPVSMFSSAGGTGSTAAQTWNGGSGGFIFSGIYNGTKSTVNNSGGTLTIDGSGNTTIGSPTGRGDIIGAGGLIKNGSGTLTLGGTVANTYSGGNIINNGTLLAAKQNAIGSGNSLTLAGGTFKNNGAGGTLSQSIGTLTLSANSTIDMGAGASTITFSDSSAIDWSGFTLDILNWTPGDTISFGSSSSGLTQPQLADIFFGDLGNASAQIDSLGDVTPAPVPEPSALSLGLIGGLGVILGTLLRRRQQ